MITSIVISNPQDWADESILLPHELIRNAIIRMETVLYTENFEIIPIGKCNISQR